MTINFVSDSRAGASPRLNSCTDSKDWRAGALRGNIDRESALKLRHAGRACSTKTPYFQLKDKYSALSRAHFTLFAQQFSSTPSDRGFQLAIFSIREPSALS